jgi:hypothetical protein
MQRACLALLVLCTLRCAAPKDSAADAGDAEPAPAQGIALSAVVIQAVDPPGTRGPNLDGVEVCQDRPRHCVKTAYSDVALAKGWFTLDGLMPESEILLVLSKEGFAPLLQPIVTPRWSSVIGTIRLASLDYLEAGALAAKSLLADAGRPAPDIWPASPGRALIVFGSDSGFTSELRVLLDPPSGEGPFFALGSADGISVTALDVPAGRAAVFGFYTNVEPRAEGYELVYEHAHGDCKYFPGTLGGWPSASERPNAVRVPARADHMTGFTSVHCKARNDSAPAVDAAPAADAAAG